MKIGILAVLALSVSLGACRDDNSDGHRAYGKRDFEAARKEVEKRFETRGPDADEADERDYADVVFLTKNCPHFKRPLAWAMKDGKLTNYEARLLYLALQMQRKKQDEYDARLNYYEARAATDPSYRIPTPPKHCRTYVSYNSFRGHVAFSRKDEQ